MYGVIVLILASCLWCEVCGWKPVGSPQSATAAIRDLIKRPLIKRQLETETGKTFTDVYDATKFIRGDSTQITDNYYFNLPIDSDLQYAIYIVEVQVGQNEFYLLRIDSYKEVGRFTAILDTTKPDPFQITGWEYDIEDPFRNDYTKNVITNRERAVLSGYRSHKSGDSLEFFGPPFPIGRPLPMADDNKRPLDDVLVIYRLLTPEVKKEYRLTSTHGTDRFYQMEFGNFGNDDVPNKFYPKRILMYVGTKEQPTTGGGGGGGGIVIVPLPNPITYGDEKSTHIRFDNIPSTTTTNHRDKLTSFKAVGSANILRNKANKRMSFEYVGDQGFLEDQLQLGSVLLADPDIQFILNESNLKTLLQTRINKPLSGWNPTVYRRQVFVDVTNSETVTTRFFRINDTNWNTNYNEHAADVRVQSTHIIGAGVTQCFRVLQGFRRVLDRKQPNIEYFEKDSAAEILRRSTTTTLTTTTTTTTTPTTSTKPTTHTRTPRAVNATTQTQLLIENPSIKKTIEIESGVKLSRYQAIRFRRYISNDSANKFTIYFIIVNIGDDWNMYIRIDEYTDAENRDVLLLGGYSFGVSIDDTLETVAGLVPLGKLYPVVYINAGSYIPYAGDPNSPNVQTIIEKPEISRGSKSMFVRYTAEKVRVAYGRNSLEVAANKGITDVANIPISHMFVKVALGGDYYMHIRVDVNFATKREQGGVSYVLRKTVFGKNKTDIITYMGNRATLLPSRDADETMETMALLPVFRRNLQWMFGRRFDTFTVESFRMAVRVWNTTRVSIMYFVKIQVFPGQYNYIHVRFDAHHDGIASTINMTGLLTESAIGLHTQRFTINKTLTYFPKNIGNIMSKIYTDVVRPIADIPATSYIDGFQRNFKYSPTGAHAKPVTDAIRELLISKGIKRRVNYNFRRTFPQFVPVSYWAVPGMHGFRPYVVKVTLSSTEHILLGLNPDMSKVVAVRYQRPYVRKAARKTSSASRLSSLGPAYAVLCSVSVMAGVFLALSRTDAVSAVCSTLQLTGLMSYHVSMIIAVCALPVCHKRSSALPYHVTSGAAIAACALLLYYVIARAVL